MTSTTSHSHPSTTTINHHQPPSHHHYYSTTPSYPHSTSSPSLLRGCCSCLILLFCVLVLLILTIILVIILAVKPKKPHFDLRQVTVDSVGIHPIAAANGGVTLTLNIRLLFTATNPNKVAIKYGDSRFTIMYRGIPLGRGSVPGFYQPAHSVRNMETIVSVDRVNLIQGDAMDLIKDASMYDKVKLRVLGDVSAKIRVLRFYSPSVQASVNCAILISPRKQSLIDKQCGFDGLSV